MAASGSSRARRDAAKTWSAIAHWRPFTQALTAENQGREVVVRDLRCQSEDELLLRVRGFLGICYSLHLKSDCTRLPDGACRAADAAR